MHEVLGLAHVAHGGRDVLVAGAAHDLDRLVAAEGHPRDAGRAEIVEGELFAGGVVGEQLGALDTGPPEVLPQAHREIAAGRHVDHAAPGCLPLHRQEQGEQRGLDGNAARPVRLRLFHLARLGAIDRPVDVDEAPIDVDVFPFERFELSGTRVGVDREREQLAPADRHAVARDHSKELRGEAASPLPRALHLRLL
ncbi:hypothetical protein WME75_21825 [Sorangium sp. So ce1014]